MKFNDLFDKILKFRKLFFNFSIRSFANLFSKLLGLITLPIITRALGPEAYGNYNLVMLIAQYTSLPIAVLGLRSYGIREIAAGRKEKNYAMEILSLQFTVAFISVSISFFIAYILNHSNIFFLMAVLFSYLYVFANAFDLEFFFVSQKDLAFPTLAKILGQLVYLIGVIIFIKKPDDYIKLVFFSSLSFIISDIIQLVRYIKLHTKFKIKINFNSLWMTFKETWILGISQNIEGFIPTIPQILLSMLAGVYALGIFAGGIKIYSVMILFYVTFFYALAPYLVQLNEYSISKKKKYHLLLFVLVLIASSAVGSVLYFWGEPIVLLLLGKGFGESTTIFKMVSITIIPLMPIIMLFGNILIYSGNEKYYLYSLILNGISNVLSSYFLINKYKAIGAVYVMILGALVSVTSLFFFYYKTELAGAKKNAN